MIFLDHTARETLIAGLAAGTGIGFYLGGVAWFLVMKIPKRRSPGSLRRWPR